MGRLNRFKDDLTYKDLAGRKRPRRYVLASLGILALLGGIVLWGWRLRQNVAALGTGLPSGVILGEGSLEGLSPLATDRVALMEALPSLTTAVISDPPSGATVPFMTQTPEACPPDPGEWELLEIARDDNFKRIVPPCVYGGLARTVAWELLRALGYSAPEAAETLGFADLAWRPMPEIVGMTNARGPVVIELEYAGAEVKSSDLRTWIVDQGGNPGLTFTLRGCYHTMTVEGDLMESWGVAYPVVCVVSVDHMDWAFMEHGTHRYVFEISPLRQFALYGYAGDGLWVGLGYQKEPVVEIRLPGFIHPAILPLAMDLEKIAGDRRFIAGRHGLVPWDAAWLGATFGLTMRPLPESWQSFDDPAELQAIQEETGPVIEIKEAP